MRSTLVRGMLCTVTMTDDDDDANDDDDPIDDHDDDDADDQDIDENDDLSADVVLFSCSLKRLPSALGLSCWSPVINIMRHPLWGR
jgi:hypothetical protein